MGRDNIIFLLAVVSVATTVSGMNQQRIVGGMVTTHNIYPYMVSLEYSWNLVSYQLVCGGSILNSRYILSAAHCFHGQLPIQWRIRFSSSWAHSNGWLYQVEAIIPHPEFNPNTYEHDLAILRTDRALELASGQLHVASLGSAAYDATLNDGDGVIAIGWGAEEQDGRISMQLRHVDLSIVNKAACQSRYSAVGINVPANSVCAGWLDIGGRDQCTGDEGGPLIYNGVVVGVYSFGYGCAHASYPSINTRVGPYIPWIQSVANYI